MKESMELFTGEVMGVAILAFLVVSTEFYIDRKEFINKGKKMIFAIAVGVSILISLMVPRLFVEGASHINPGTSLMFAILSPNLLEWKELPFAWGGQFVGGFTGVALACIMHYPLTILYKDNYVKKALTIPMVPLVPKNHVAQTTSTNNHSNDSSLVTFFKSFFTESMAMFLLMFAIAVTWLSFPHYAEARDVDHTGIIMGFMIESLGLALILIIFGDLPYLLNLSVNIPILAAKAFYSRGVGLKSQLMSRLGSVIPHFAMPAVAAGILMNAVPPELIGGH